MFYEKLALFAAGRHLPLHKYHDAKAVSMLVEAGAVVKKGGGLRYNILRWLRVTSDDAYRVLCESQSPASMYFELPWGDANCFDAWTIIREMKTLDGEDMQARLLLNMREALLSGTYDVQKWKNALLGGELLPPLPPPMLQSQPVRVSWCTFNCGGKLTPLLVRAILALTGPEVDYNVVLMLQEVRREEAATQAIVEQAVQQAPGQTPLPFVVVSEPGISAPGSLTVVGGACVMVFIGLAFEDLISVENISAATPLGNDLELDFVRLMSVILTRGEEAMQEAVQRSREQPNQAMAGYRGMGIYLASLVVGLAATITSFSTAASNMG